MSDYYYNERKGRYEPVSEAPFGIVPKEKRSRNVFTPEDYIHQTEEQFSDYYSGVENEKRYHSVASPAGKAVNTFTDVINDAFGNMNSSGSGSSTVGRTSQQYSSKQTSTQSSEQKTAQKGKSKAGLVFAAIWILFFVIKACSE